MSDERVETRTEQGLTKDQLLHFRESGIYRAFMATAGLRLAAIRDDLMSPASTRSLEDVRFLQGEINGVEFWVQFTDKLLKDLENE